VLLFAALALPGAALGHGPGEAGGTGADDRTSLVRVEVRSMEHLAELEAAGATPWACRPGTGLQLMSADAAVAEALVARGAAMVEADLEAAYEAMGPQVGAASGGARGGGFFDAYQTFETIDDELDALASSPLAEIVVVGETLEGRTVRGVRLGAAGPGAPAVLVNGAQHAREWISPAACMYLADRLVSTYGSDPDVTAVLDRVDVIVIPVVNADGYVYSFTPGNRFWRKNRRDNGGGFEGVDPNRNWAEAWGGSGSSSFPGSEIYRGPAPFSEPCTANLRDFIIANPEIRGHLDVHSFAQLVLGAWAHTNDPAPRPETLLPLGEAINTAIVGTNGADFDFRTGAGGIGFAAGSMPDWTFGELGVMSWTFELRDQGQFGFALPADQIIPASEECYNGIMRLAQQIALCPSDLNLDGVVDSADLGLLLARWNTDRGLADADVSGVVDSGDLGAILAAWGSACPL